MATVAARGGRGGGSERTDTVGSAAIGTRAIRRCGRHSTRISDSYIKNCASQQKIDGHLGIAARSVFSGKFLCIQKLIFLLPTRRTNTSNHKHDFTACAHVHVCTHAHTRASTTCVHKSTTPAPPQRAARLRSATHWWTRCYRRRPAAGRMASPPRRIPTAVELLAARLSRLCLGLYRTGGPPPPPPHATHARAFRGSPPPAGAESPAVLPSRRRAPEAKRKRRRGPRARNQHAIARGAHASTSATTPSPTTAPRLLSSHATRKRARRHAPTRTHAHAHILAPSQAYAWMC